MKKFNGSDPVSKDSKLISCESLANGCIKKVFIDKWNHQTIIYYDKNMRFHREDGPAWDSSVSFQWYVNGESHRNDGPALIYKDVEHFMWAYNGRELFSKEEWFECLTPEEKQNYIWNMNESS